MISVSLAGTACQVDRDGRGQLMGKESGVHRSRWILPGGYATYISIGRERRTDWTARIMLQSGVAISSDGESSVSAWKCRRNISRDHVYNPSHLACPRHRVCTKSPETWSRHQEYTRHYKTLLRGTAPGLARSPGDYQTRTAMGISRQQGGSLFSPRTLRQPQTWTAC